MLEHTQTHTLVIIHIIARTQTFIIYLVFKIVFIVLHNLY